MPNNPQDVHVETRSKQINFRLSHGELLELKEVAKEMDFPFTTLARRILKQYLKRHREEKQAEKN